MCISSVFVKRRCPSCIVDDDGNEGDDDDDDADDDDTEPIVKKIKFASPHDMKSDIIEVQQIPSVNPNDPPFYTSVMKVSTTLMTPFAFLHFVIIIGLSKERPILGDHPKAHIHEIRQISQNLADFTSGGM